MLVPAGIHVPAGGGAGRRLLGLRHQRLRYGLPLAGAGWLLALFHNLLYFGFVTESLQPCGAGPSCSGADMTISGLPLPLLSLGVFSLLLILLEILRRRVTP